MSNEELAARIQAGERELMPELWEQVRRFVAKMAVRRYLFSNGYGGVEVEDLIQSGYLALCEAVAYFQPDGEYKFTSYLGNCLKTAFSEAGGYRSNRQYHDPLHSCASLDTPLGDDPDGDTLGDLQADPVDLIEDADRRMWLEQLRAAVEEALEDLPADQRETLRRRFWDGLTLEEIGTAEGIPAQIVRTREKKALRMIRQRRRLAGFAEEYRTYIDERTSWYLQVGASTFNNTHSSAVEELAVRRENMAEKLAREDETRGRMLREQRRVRWERYNHG